MKIISLKEMERTFAHDYYMYVPLTIILNSCLGYSDGLDNELQRRVQFDAGNGVAVTGRQIVNNKGLVVAQYEPYLETVFGVKYSVFSGR